MVTYLRSRTFSDCKLQRPRRLSTSYGSQDHRHFRWPAHPEGIKVGDTFTPLELRRLLSVEGRSCTVGVCLTPHYLAIFPGSSCPICHGYYFVSGRHKRLYESEDLFWHVLPGRCQRGYRYIYEGTQELNYGAALVNAHIASCMLCTIHNFN